MRRLIERRCIFSGFSFRLDRDLIAFTVIEFVEMIAHFPGVMSVKSADLNSLDLILAPFRGAQCFAIRCHVKQGNQHEAAYLLLGPKFFNEIKEPILQTYLVGGTALSFGQDYRFDIDVAPENVNFPGEPENVAGLVIHEGQSYFRFVYDPHSGIRRMNLLDLSTGEVIQDFPHGQTTLIRRWSISVGLGAEEKPAVIIPIS